MPMTTRRGTVEANEKKRPKRNAPIKSIDDTVGMSWREEKELKKALYASLQESRRQGMRAVVEEELGPPILVPINPQPGPFSTHPNAPSTPLPSLGQPLSRRASWNGSRTVSRTGSLDESSQDSNRSSLASVCLAPLSPPGKRTKIHAQRKFAQSSLPCSPSSTPVCNKPSPLRLLPRTAKTEDFLTFLCLRGSTVLPPHLDFSMKVPEDDTESTQSRGQGSKTGAMRESTPDSCSSSSSANEELYETATPSPISLASALLSSKSLALRKAARASASTPETARGIISLRQGLSSKTSGLARSSSRQRRSPRDQTPSPSKAPRMGRGELTPHTKQALQKARRTPRFSPRHPSPAKPADRKKVALPKERHRLSSLRTDKVPPRSPHGTFRPVEPATKGGGASSSRGRGAQAKDRRSQGKVSRPSTRDAPRSHSRARDKHKRRKTSGSERRGGVRRVSSRRSSLRLKALKKAVAESQRRRSTSNTFTTTSTTVASAPGSDASRAQSATVPSISPEGVSTRRTQRPDSSTSLPKDSLLGKAPAANPTRRLSQKPSSAEQRRLARIIERRRSNSRSEEKPSPPLSSTASPPRPSSKSAPKTSRKQPGTKSALAAERSIKLEPFPAEGEAPQLVEVPIFYPTPEEFHDPLVYIAHIAPQARSYGMCKVVPPPSWKMESKMNEDMRFSVQIQYVHKLFKRWGPAVQQEACIYQHLRNMGASLERCPQVGGVEVDLARLSQTVLDCGGLQNVVDKKCWVKIADIMRIPKQAQDRGTKLYDIYCKYVLPYDTLSSEEKARLEQAVLAERQRKERQKEKDECTAKGRSRPLSAFSRVACNVQSMWFKSQPSPEQVENEYWQLVEEGSSHVAVQSGHVFAHSTAFPVRRDNPYIRHGWNLNNLRQNTGSVLRCLGPIPGVTMPSLHAGMLFSTSCWSCSPQALPFIQYLHCGSDIIWYSVPEQQEGKFKTALQELVPSLVADRPLWLKKDTIMVRPDTLVEKGVSVGHCVQRPRQFVVVFPQACTSTISCGYNLSESVLFAPPEWIPSGLQAAQKLNSCHVAEEFSMEGLLVQLCQDPNTPVSLLSAALPHLQSVLEREMELRQQLQEAGLTVLRRMEVAEAVAPSPHSSKTRKRSHSLLEAQETLCDATKKICYLSMVVSDQEDVVLCMEAGLSYIHKKRNLKTCRLLYRMTEEEMRALLQKVRDRIDGASAELAKKRSPKKTDPKT